MKWKELIKIGISGSRRFKEPSLAVQYLEKFVINKYENTEELVFLTGGALGIDAAVELMCMRRGIKNLIVHARWVELELVAGPRRNGHIVNLANEMYAFWDGSSKGTKSFIDKAQKTDKSLTIWSYEGLIKKLKVAPVVHMQLPEKVKKVESKRVKQYMQDAKDFFA
jgi:hypothetical protein